MDDIPSFFGTQLIGVGPHHIFSMYYGEYEKSCGRIDEFIRQKVSWSYWIGSSIPGQVSESITSCPVTDSTINTKKGLSGRQSFFCNREGIFSYFSDSCCSPCFRIGVIKWNVSVGRNPFNCLAHLIGIISIFQSSVFPKWNRSCNRSPGARMLIEF